MIRISTTNKLSKLLCLFAIILLSSCGTTKNVPYFQNVSIADSSSLSATAVFHEPTIQPDDILSISVFTIDPTTSMVINQLGTQALSSGQVGAPGSSAINGFLVDKNGEIEISVIGRVKLLGLTTFEARDLIRDIASKSYNNPNVQVRYANFKLTILGEVARPATYTVPNEKLTVLDALGLAGDLTIYGKRENVLLIRGGNGVKQFARLNLNSADLFNSPFFYLKQNDVLYVEPNKGKAASLNTARTQSFALIGTALTVLITLATRIF
ncbi:polysaccharide biosynthesis/export family protein [Pedobacter sp. AW31-3R]|uniref:polysaccharide biosynthesis/export family protein n=1 Tax=Pedobacter sp. AW31-3R TaxID=3445781 RepID=UPI003FA054DE